MPTPHPPGSCAVCVNQRQSVCTCTSVRGMRCPPWGPRDRGCYVAPPFWHSDTIGVTWPCCFLTIPEACGFMTPLLLGQSGVGMGIPLPGPWLLEMKQDQSNGRCHFRQILGLGCCSRKGAGVTPPPPSPAPPPLVHPPSGSLLIASAGPWATPVVQLRWSRRA